MIVCLGMFPNGLVAEGMEMIFITMVIWNL